MIKVISGIQSFHESSCFWLFWSFHIHTTVKMHPYIFKYATIDLFYVQLRSAL